MRRVVVFLVFSFLVSSSVLWFCCLLSSCPFLLECWFCCSVLSFLLVFAASVLVFFSIFVCGGFLWFPYVLVFLEFSVVCLEVFRLSLYPWFFRCCFGSCLDLLFGTLVRHALPTIPGRLSPIHSFAGTIRLAPTYLGHLLYSSVKFGLILSFCSCSLR